MPRESNELLRFWLEYRTPSRWRRCLLWARSLEDAPANARHRYYSSVGVRSPTSAPPSAPGVPDLPAGGAPWSNSTCRAGVWHGTHRPRVTPPRITTADPGRGDGNHVQPVYAVSTCTPRGATWRRVGGRGTCGPIWPSDWQCRSIVSFRLSRPNRSRPCHHPANLE